MSATATHSGQDTFFVRLSQSKTSILLLDYDGTLAPFRLERDCAVPYPAVPEFLDGIRSNGHTRVVIISGRPAREIPALLRLCPPPEIWGSHGMERLLPDGHYTAIKLERRLTEAFARAAASLDREGLSRHMEWKHGSLAVHWRGLPSDDLRAVCATASRVLQPLAFSAGLHLSHFDGGMEMRVRTPNKADAVRAILKESGEHCPIAYLGDDVSDEDAFAAVNPVGLTALVREEYRPTSARLWLHPPNELLAFFEQWLHACGGDV